MSHPIATISLSALRANLRRIKELCGHGRVMPMVKANAYGHGMVEIARVLVNEGVTALGVATTEEAITLWKAGIRTRIVIIYPPLPEEIADILRYDLECSVDTLSMVEFIQHLAHGSGKRPRLHLCIDTGMHHNGAGRGAAAKISAYIQHSPYLHLQGISTHFACSDSADPTFTRLQIERFQRSLESFDAQGVSIEDIHIANSSGILHYREAHKTLVRCGIALYGYGDGDFEKVLSLTAPVIAIRDIDAGESVGYGATWTAQHSTRIATIAIGYGDGYRRSMSNNGEILLGGKRRPIIGRICMDAVMVELEAGQEVSLGEMATLIGSDGNESIWAHEVAKRCDTIDYEILTSLTGRIERRYE